ncbi:lamin tail domain-containing protein [Caldithrix abyssi]
MKTLHIISTIILAMIFAVAGCKLDDTVSADQETPPHQSAYQLFINEFMASNDACCTDENGEYDDWIELYNGSEDTVSLAGFYLSDDKSAPKKFQIPLTADLRILPHGFVVLWADGQPEQGVTHLDFKLSSGGEDIVLTEPDGYTVVDEYTFEAQETDVSMGRVPDGGTDWQRFTTPTPGAPNVQGETSVPPTIKTIQVLPDTINAGDVVTIRAQIVDEDEDLAQVTLTYGAADSLNTTVNMTAENDSVFSSQLGPFADGTRVFFYIVASDDADHSTRSDTLSFEVGYVPPALYINEFLASNDSSNADENGEYDDWIEIYNAESRPINIGGMYISDDKGDLTAWQIPTSDSAATTIPAGGFLLLWADKQPEQGVLHVNIKLSSGGEDIVLTAPNGTTVIDSLTFGEQTTDVSMGRLPDGSDNWVSFTNPTPGASNHQ